MPENTNAPPDPAARAKVAFRAIGELIIGGGLPPDALEHLKAAHASILAHATVAGTPPEANEGAVPVGESVAATKRRDAGEDPGAKEPDDESDDAPRAKGTRTNPLGIKGWASSPVKDDDEPEPAKPKPKPAGTLAKGGKARFVRR
jgi:hypothetical protein